MVTSRGTHGLSCKRSSGRSTRHQQINDAIWRALKRVDVPSTKEPAGLLRGDGKLPNGLTLVPWQSGRSLTWDVTVVDTLANSYTPTTSVTSCGAAAEAAATRKRAKYAEIIQSHHFVPIAIETLRPIKMDGQRFLDSLGERLSSISGDSRENTFLYQRLSVLIQIFQCGCLLWFSTSRDSYRRLTPEPVFIFVFNPRDLYHRGCYKKI